MTISGFLPQRWRASPEAARHAEAIAGILHTPPLEQTSGPGMISLLGTAQVLPYLVAIKSLHRRLGRGSIAIVDDGTLTGEDRAILAHHCSDPQIVPHQAVRRGPFPAGAAWALLLTILDRRAGQFWIALDPHTVTQADVPEVAEALGIAETTVKTHLGRIYEKTATARQADLVKLVAGYSNSLVG